MNYLRKISYKTKSIYSVTCANITGDKARLIKKFGSLPVPSGNYAGPLESINIEDVSLTPFGFISHRTGAYSILEIPDGSSEEKLINIEISSTTSSNPLIPKVIFLDGSGKALEKEKLVRITSANSAELLCLFPSEAKKLKIIFSEKETFFAIHSISIKRTSYSEIIKKDLDDSSSRHRAVICFPVIDWDYRFQRPQHLLRELAKSGDHICYISTALYGYGTEQITPIILEERVTKLCLPGNPRLNLYKHTPSSRSVDVGCNAITSFLLERGFEDVVILVHLPFWLPYALKLKEERGYPIIYDCMDDHSGFENNSIEMLRTEKELKKNSDLIITSSQKLYDEVRSDFPNTALIRNAGDPEHFSKAALDKSLEESELVENLRQKFKGPVIGYFGAIAEWFDVEAILHAANSFPDYNFVLIGYCPDDLKAELSKDNIFLLGEVKYEELPSYLSMFDICTIPFKRIPLTEATNPVKLYEYFASGKPVVARSLPEIELYNELCYLYNTPSEFVELLSLALKEEASDIKKEKRIEVSNNETWEKRGNKVKELIRNLQKKVSIIILSYESLPYLRECLSSIVQNTSYENYEIVIVDNASSPEVREYLKVAESYYPKIKLIQNEENKGFAAGNNQGLLYAKDSDYFILLNNDVVVPSGWIERLIYYASKPELGLIGPVTNNIGNEAKIDTNYRTIPEMSGFSWGIRKQLQGEYFDINVVAMFCVAFRKEVFDAVGYLDESFGIGMFEDDDYAERTRASGFRVVCVEDVFIHHYGSISFSQLSKDDYKKIFEDNKDKYEKKWGSWIPHAYRS